MSVPSSCYDQEEARHDERESVDYKQGFATSQSLLSEEFIVTPKNNFVYNKQSLLQARL